MKTFQNKYITAYIAQLLNRACIADEYTRFALKTLIKVLAIYKKELPEFFQEIEDSRK